ncbi:DUF2076 domain-containing protein [Devosia sp.]|uniref:DUF2076 domain-containing protein n=1 Tax=Devosia sp. TaxID=1871048 RepID=UPI0035B1C283
MLNPEDRRAIEGLFDRLAEAERRAPDRDREADELIRGEIGRLPNAPYYMAQTIVVQQQALEAAEKRIKELEQEARGREARRGPWDRAQDDGYDQRQRGGGFGGGGFLGGAMQTALGVAGGVLLGSAIGSLFGAGGAHAAEAPADSGQDAGGQDDTNDAGGGDDMGGDDFGGDGGFDMGGDF